MKNVDSEKQSGQDDVGDANKDSSANEQEEKEQEEKEPEEKVHLIHLASILYLLPL